MQRTTEIVNCSTPDSLPSIERISLIPRNIKLKVVFGRHIQNLRESIGNQWKKALPDFFIGIHTVEPEINIAKLISDEEILEHQIFFERCAKDYHSLATKLITDLAIHLKVEINLDRPMDTFGIFKMGKQRGVMNPWEYFFHGGHCAFFNTKTNQEIEVSLLSGAEFGALDAYFFTKYILSTVTYSPLPVELYEEYGDGTRILEGMIKLGKFERVYSDGGWQRDIIVKGKNKPN
ncbi:hypothetical protein Q4E93_18285 [Flavitalea sp. BT771]|uniref:DUF6896 domain-containing protein n=1 Tax=Flavitalea sp. BT771 TaxID=3063329 RepID=UPI0026E15B41|nr:hypothetical protein [Flavitalea sp. BT771]MDO6432560.1 hypothetical protein [Flavitalea sp. BT771]MDV6221469.1 hypothetical protein [Flavitalea sp. BT771]